MALEVEIVTGGSSRASAPEPDVRRGVVAALAAAGIDDGHLAVTLVSSDEIRRLNGDHRGRDEPTDVLSFPIDEREPAGPRELGDVVICPEHAHDVVRAAVHGTLHLAGYDHPGGEGEMLALEDDVVSALR